MEVRIVSLAEKNKKMCENNNQFVGELDDLRQCSRRNCLRILGLPEQNNENTVDVRLSLSNQKMKINVDGADTDRAHRLGS